MCITNYFTFSCSHGLAPPTQYCNNGYNPFPLRRVSRITDSKVSPWVDRYSRPLSSSSDTSRPLGSCPAHESKHQRLDEKCGCCVLGVAVVRPFIDYRAVALETERRSKSDGKRDEGLPYSLRVVDPKIEAGYQAGDKRMVAGEDKVEPGRRKWRERWYAGEYEEAVGQANEHMAFSPPAKKE